MCPDQISIGERLSARPPGNRGSVVTRTEQAFTGHQVLTFLGSVCVFTAALVGGWQFIRVSGQIGKLKNSGDAAKALGQIKDLGALQPLLNHLKTGKANDEVEREVAKALGDLGPPALEPLMAALRDKDLSGYAGEGLVQLGRPAVDPLIAMLNNTDAGADPGLRERAAELLGEVGDTRAVEPLIATLKDNSPPAKGPVPLDAYGVPLPHPTEGDGLREQSARALGKIKDPRADGPLIAAMEDSDERVHQIAAHALGEINDPQAVNFLLKALREHNTEVIAGACDFFVQIGRAS